MKFTLSWLKDYLKTDAGLPEILDAMMRAGLEVEHVEDPAEKLKDFTIAKVIEAKPHPDADKLRVCTVETKDGTKQIVCGAPNARTGMTAVYAPLGTFIPGLDFALDKKPRKIRGVESHGMMCSERELDMSDEHDGIIDLPEDAPIGTSFAAYAGLDDPVIEINLTPNRPDCTSIYGIARDLAASGLGTRTSRQAKPGHRLSSSRMILTFCVVSPSTGKSGAFGVFSFPSPEAARSRAMPKIEVQSFALVPKYFAAIVTGKIIWPAEADCLATVEPLGCFLTCDLDIRLPRAGKMLQARETPRHSIKPTVGLRRTLIFLSVSLIAT